MKKYFGFAAAAAVMAAGLVPAITYAATTAQQDEIVVTGKHQKMWDKGAKLEAEGTKALPKAESALNDASRDVLEAQKRRDKAGGKIIDASSEFRQLTSNVPQFSTPKDAAKWADQVSDAADKWAKNDNRQDDGQDDLKSAMKRQSKAQTNYDKALSDIDKGRAMKTEAEQRSVAGR